MYLNVIVQSAVSISICILILKMIGIISPFYVWYCIIASVVCCFLVTHIFWQMLKEDCILVYRQRYLRGFKSTADLYDFRQILRWLPPSVYAHCYRRLRSIDAVVELLNEIYEARQEHGLSYVAIKNYLAHY